MITCIETYQLNENAQKDGFKLALSIAKEKGSSIDIILPTLGMPNITALNTFLNKSDKDKIIKHKIISFEGISIKLYSKKTFNQTTTSKVLFLIWVGDKFIKK